MVLAQSVRPHRPATPTIPSLRQDGGVMWWWYAQAPAAEHACLRPRENPWGVVVVWAGRFLAGSGRFHLEGTQEGSSGCKGGGGERDEEGEKVQTGRLARRASAASMLLPSHLPRNAFPSPAGPHARKTERTKKKMGTHRSSSAAREASTIDNWRSDGEGGEGLLAPGKTSLFPALLISCPPTNHEPASGVHHYRTKMREKKKKKRATACFSARETELETALAWLPLGRA